MEINVVKITTQTLNKSLFAQLEEEPAAAMAGEVIGWVNYQGTHVLLNYQGRLVRVRWAEAASHKMQQMGAGIEYERRRELLQEWKHKLPQIMLK